MPELWTPNAELPHEAFIDRLHKAIASFAEANGVETPFVEVELADDAPDALIVPIGSLRRIELSKGPEEKVQRFGFSVPPAT